MHDINKSIGIILKDLEEKGQGHHSLHRHLTAGHQDVGMRATLTFAKFREISQLRLDTTRP